MVSPDYAAVIGVMITLQQQVALGVTDRPLTSDVQTLNSLSLAKDRRRRSRPSLTRC